MRIATIAGLLLMLLPAWVVPCACEDVAGPINILVKDALDNADIVFLGHVTNTAEKSITDKNTDEYSEIQTTHFNVIKSWKGDTENITTTINIACCVCGFVFEKNSDYLIYAYKRADGTLSTSTCHRTQEAKLRKEDIKYLDILTKLKFKN